jgi:16S rRNA (cytosine967-C5)-methyltransferase
MSERREAGIPPSSERGPSGPAPKVPRADSMSERREVPKVPRADKTSSTRGLAVEALVRIDDGAYAHILVPELLRKAEMEPRDRALVTDLVYGTVRMRRAVDHLLAPLSSRPLDTLDPQVRAALRLGAFQLLIGIAPHAAVAETVEAVDKHARGYVNGTLRSLTRGGPPWKVPAGDDIVSIGLRTSHPDWIVQTLVDEFGTTDALATLRLNDEPPPVTMRVNTARADVTEIADELRAAGAEVETGALVPDALLVRRAGDLGALPALRDGLVTPQDQASQAVVAVLDPQPGDRVLELAAAPGGKATATAERLRDSGVVVACDLHPGRVHALMRAVRRVHGEHLVVPVVADGRRPPVRDAAFDRVLLDAPCTGLGVLRRRPDARWRVQPHDVDALAALQRDMLRAAARSVRPGGRFVYSVCTLTRPETIGVDEWARTALPEFAAEPPPAAPWRPHGRGAIVLPSDARSDGMFVLVLERSG